MTILPWHLPNVGSSRCTDLFNHFRCHLNRLGRYAGAQPCSTLTPIRTSNDGIIFPRARRSLACYTKVGKLHRPVLISENICSFDIAMYDTLIMQIDQTLQHLRYVHGNQVLWEFAESFDDIM